MNRPADPADVQRADGARLAPTTEVAPDVAARPSRRRWLRKRARLLAGVTIMLLFYFVAATADLLAPYDYRAQSRNEPAAPPTPLHWRDAEGHWHARPFIYTRRLTDPLARTYTEDTKRAYPLTLLMHGYSYHLFGLLPTDRHLFGVSADAPDRPASAPLREPVPRVYLLGTDANGRDRFSRLLHATRFSLFVGPVGTLLAGLLGILIGCAAGYAGRTTETLLMRTADAMLALPELVLILAARAALPVTLAPMKAALFLIAIFIVLGWAAMARVTRGLVLALRQREFVLAAVGLGLTRPRILFRHILPNAARPLVVQLSLMLPVFLLAETALSFLGVGVQEPEASWGNMLIDAGNLPLLSAQPFVLLMPALAIFIFVLGVRLLTDGLRQRTDRV